jgi:hypothetical protein
MGFFSFLSFFLSFHPAACLVAVPTTVEHDSRSTGLLKLSAGRSVTAPPPAPLRVSGRFLKFITIIKKSHMLAGFFI